MSESASSDRVDIKSDEDWKEQVRREARQQDEQRASESRGSPEGESPRADQDFEYLPPASFPLLVQMFSTQALVALGLLPDPQTGQAAPRLTLARHFIDLLGVLEAKTKGQLTGDEEALLTATLHELRMAYVERARNAGT